MTTDRPFSPATLGDRWGCSAQHVRDLIAKGVLKSFRAGKLIRIPAAEVERVEATAESQDQNVQPTRRVAGADVRLV